MDCNGGSVDSVLRRRDMKTARLEWWMSRCGVAGEDSPEEDEYWVGILGGRFEVVIIVLLE